MYQTFEKQGTVRIVQYKMSLKMSRPGSGHNAGECKSPGRLGVGEAEAGEADVADGVLLAAPSSVIAVREFTDFAPFYPATISS